MNTQTYREMWIVTKMKPEAAMTHCLLMVMSNKELLAFTICNREGHPGVEVAPQQGSLLFA